MTNKTSFHGSDIEKIASHYKVPMDSLVNFAANVNPLGFPASVSEAIASNLDVLSTYPDREYTRLREVIGAYCKVDSNHIMVGNGSSELIALLIHQISSKKTLILGPTYSEYQRELASLNSSIEVYNLKSEEGFRLNQECFLEQLAHQYDLLVLCNPNNPTSSFLPNNEVEVILERCKRHHTFVMIDETYIEFVADCQEASAVSLIQRYDNFMILRGVSKFFAAPGLRLGYGITSNVKLLENMKNLQIPWSLNSIGAYAGELLFTDQTYIHATKTLIEKERRHLLSELHKLSELNVFPANANFILLQITKDNTTAHDVFLACLKEGCLIRDCSSFDSLDGQFVRFCIMNPEDNRRLLRVFSELFN